jgi:hypothetical protein
MKGVGEKSRGMETRMTETFSTVSPTESLIREKSHCTIFTIDSRNQESAQKNPIAPFLPLIPETRNLRRFLVSGINGKNGAMGFFSDQSLILFVIVFQQKSCAPSLRSVCRIVVILSRCSGQIDCELRHPSSATSSSSQPAQTMAANEYAIVLLYARQMDEKLPPFSEAISPGFFARAQQMSCMHDIS